MVWEPASQDKGAEGDKEERAQLSYQNHNDKDHGGLDERNSSTHRPYHYRGSMEEEWCISTRRSDDQAMTAADILDIVDARKGSRPRLPERTGRSRGSRSMPNLPKHIMDKQ